MIDWRDRHVVVPAVYVLLQKDKQVLLLRRANTGYHDGEYTLPTGHLNGHEAATTAAIREAKEEVGVDVDPAGLHMVQLQHYVAEERSHERMTLFFKAEKWRGEPSNTEPETCDDVRWFPADQLPDNLVSEARIFFERFAAGETLVEYGF